jgi:hypothetical protein
MAKGKVTTAKPCRASAPKATSSPSQILCRLEDAAHAEVFGLQHLAELMELMGDCVGTPRASWTDLQMQHIGLRIEYCSALVKRHADEISTALIKIRTTAERLQRRGAQ